MSREQWDKLRGQWLKVREQWQGNLRLRVAAMFIVVFAGLHVLDALDGRRAKAAAQYEADLQLRERMELVAAQPEWTKRASQAEAELDALRRQMMQVGSAGQAQAEARAWLTELAGTVGLEGPTIKLESVLDVPGHADLQQVLARLDGKLPEFGQAALLRGLSRGLPWVQVERLELGEQAKSSRVNMVVRFYYKRGAGDAPATAEEKGP
ncbi:MULTISPECIES: hypothetical protein [Stenotrophomonas]|uniref:hypothetical protein n=1 Tax=Stenotrophomonas TaxID=40323 RepID=UPI001F05135E|nr:MULTISPECIES: hypothetical protein [Stenotrophomonas]MCH1910220.1 hypothetical protein [Stenotrophomonas sp. Y6]